MLDMDGTILDLAFDNYVWGELVPQRYAEQSSLPYETARDQLFSKYRALQGNLDWYCLDHWTERLGIDVLQLHHEVQHRIGYLPGARKFLETVRESDIKVLLVTNSHPDTLELKDNTVGFSDCFDSLHTSHTYGHAKESQEFWRGLQDEVGFNPENTMFVDDTVSVLRSAGEYGIGTLVTVTRPDTTEPVRESNGFASVEGVHEMM